MTVAPSKKGDDRKAADDDNLKDENGSPHDPIEGDDAGTVIHADVTSFRAR